MFHQQGSLPTSYQPIVAPTLRLPPLPQPRRAAALSSSASSSRLVPAPALRLPPRPQPRRAAITPSSSSSSRSMSTRTPCPLPAQQSRQAAITSSFSSSSWLMLTRTPRPVPAQPSRQAAIASLPKRFLNPCSPLVTKRARHPPKFYEVEHLSLNSDSDDVYTEENEMSTNNSSDSSPIRLINGSSPPARMRRDKQREHVPKKGIPDILRYTFAGNRSLQLQPPQTQAVGTIKKSQVEIWNSAVNRFCMNTSYDCRPSFTLSSGFRSLSNAKSNVFWKVFPEDELGQLLVQASANDNASIDDLSGSDSDESSGYDSDSLSVSASDDESDASSDLANPGYIEDYEKTKQSMIFLNHKSDPGLQRRTARCFLPEGQHVSSASFRCPDPDCHDEWPSDTPIYAWYQHLESPKHRPNLDSCGQLACEFGYGRSFLDEWQQFIHYNSRSCSQMDRSTFFMSYTCPRGPVVKAQYHCHYNSDHKFGNFSYAVLHWVTFHDQKRYNLPGFVSCSVCKIGFLNQAMYASHFQVGYGDGKHDANTHATALMENGDAQDPTHYYDVVDQDQHVVPSDDKIQGLLTLAKTGFSCASTVGSSPNS